ncbi:uncharacterized protein KGF55_002260 [Candida pseudojiufengensis]|uniref:uncharacterized protein n=1 Tax=Candida pseudojiufengensis TaxID=497109 RepID=UPI002224D000|nr:uncharacterized protein KGF55_002260 [Candida pseudojiufengensis]KAI5964318.1 hypothetical protein KGF55_002260 [Candida pseudojiufengensis]
MSSSPPHSHSSSNYSYGPVIKPELASISGGGGITQTSSSSSFRSPTSISTGAGIIDQLPPSNLSDIESIDYQQQHGHEYSQRPLRSQHSPQLTSNPQSSRQYITADDQNSQISSSNSIAVDETIIKPIIRQPSPQSSNSVSPISSSHSSQNHQRIGINLNELQNTSSLESLITKPINLQNLHNNHYQKRASMFSSFSQYSGKIENDIAIPMTLQRTDTSKLKKYNKNEDNEDEHDDGDASSAKHDKIISSNHSVETNQLLDKSIENDENSFSSSRSINQDNENKHVDITTEESQSEQESDEESSILMGKLPTSSKSKSKTNENLNINPDKSFNTNIEGAVPARSPRRPISMIANTTSASVTSPSPKKNSRRKSTQINDDLDKLMYDASSMQSNDPTQKIEEEEDILNKNLKYEDDDIHDDSLIVQKRQKNKLHRASTDTTNSKPLLEKLNDINDEEETEKNRALVGEKELDIEGEGKEITAIPECSSKLRNLPPRPTQENINNARKISESHKQPQPQHHRTEPKSILNPTTLDDDDQYYDVDDEDEKIPIQHRPSKAKSVKNSIRRPNKQRTTTPPLPDQLQPPTQKKKTKKSSSSKRKSKTGTNNNQELKPFSYNTLISLLESMNGTIIGEEFNSLNIPLKEKQLIEKIIDSLSRLSSDMIMDKQRYDLGILRLEKALRVLEGFN